ncbi:MAG TPA: DUF6036 family nucleotidyltransferase [Isosphaeraceae bacterium]
MEGHDLLHFLRAIDAELVEHAKAGETVDLYLLGRSALVLGYGLNLMTKDVDIVEIHDSRLQKIAEETFGRDTPAAKRLGFYLESVSSWLPPLPGGYQARCIDVEGPWTVIRPKRPEANDLAVTKLKRFHAKDREDVRILCDRGQLDPATLRKRLDSAHAFTEEGEKGRESAYANLETVIDYLEGRRRTL